MSNALPTISNPATGEPVGPAIVHTEEDVRAAVSRCRSAAGGWRKAPLRERIAVVRRFRTLLAERAVSVAQTIRDCTGKTEVDAISTEVLPGILAAGYYARIAKSVLRPTRLKRSSILFFNKRSIQWRRPWGLVGIISPWNYPFGIPLHEIIPAILAGNVVLFKPATQTQSVGEAIVNLLKEAGLPEGVVEIVHAPGAVAGDAMMNAPLDKLFFTGSTEVGGKLAAAAGERLIPISLELGGNDAMIVLEDANLERAAAGAIWAGFSNCGQSCGAVERVYVVDAVYDRFLTVLREKTSRLTHGRTDGSTDIGTLTTDAQLATVRAHLSDALAGGARVTAVSQPFSDSSHKSSSQTPPLDHEAAIVEGAEGRHRMMREETFGPLVGVQRVRDGDEAVALANDCDLGLTASVWTAHRGRGREIAERLEVGVVTLNDHLMSHGMAETPWGGYKRSGIGRTHGRVGFEEMTQIQVVVDDLAHRGKSQMWWHPHPPAVRDGLLAAIGLFTGGILRRIAASFRVVGLFLSRFRGKPS